MAWTTNRIHKLIYLHLFFGEAEELQAQNTMEVSSDNIHPTT